ncbi:NAD(+) diphosphatase [Micromonospora zhanjiangensis]|uniref:NAD(+) diphosphatase n=1 Tax=Micromonospora zhanjiangensis TaxID=1522057 RepID=A0ABV8KUP0_9ACTN
MAIDESVLTYTGGWLDRAGGLRSDPDWLAATLADPGARVIPVWRDRCLVTADGVPVRLWVGTAGDLLAAAAEPVFLGLDDGRGVFAVDLSSAPEERALALAGADRAVDVRAVVGDLSAAEAAVQAYARGILHWHRQQAFCGSCGGGTEVRAGGHVRACRGAACGRLLFPRIEPAVIVLIESPESPPRCLLARHAGAGPDSFSLLAGFVEVGENLEDAVRREVAEEAGVRLSSVTYQGSQAWPFPAGLMVGFRAVAADIGVDVDRDELVEARWFSREQLRERAAAGHRLGRVDSIDRRLLRAWLTEEAPGGSDGGLGAADPVDTPGG